MVIDLIKHLYLQMYLHIPTPFCSYTHAHTYTYYLIQDSISDVLFLHRTTPYFVPCLSGKCSYTGIVVNDCEHFVVIYHPGISNGSDQEVETVELHRDSSGSLGISITGGAHSPLGDLPIMIADLNPSGPGALSGRLKVAPSTIFGSS